MAGGPDRFAIEGAIGAERVRPGRIIVTAGTVTSPHPEGDRGERVRFALRDEDGEDWYEFLIVCPGDMQMPTVRRTEIRGLRFDLHRHRSRDHHPRSSLPLLTSPRGRDN
jgi:hypothetical protein